MRYRDAPRDRGEVSIAWRSRAFPPQSWLLALGCVFLFFFAGAADRVGSIACRMYENGHGACTLRRASFFTHTDKTVTVSRGTQPATVVRSAGRRSELWFVMWNGELWLGSRARRAEAEVDAASLDRFIARGEVGIYTATYGAPSFLPWFFLVAAAASLGFGFTRVRGVQSALTIENGRLVIRSGTERLGELLLDEIDSIALEPETVGHGIVAHVVLRTSEGGAFRITTEPGIDVAECEATVEEVRALVARAR